MVLNSCVRKELIAGAIATAVTLLAACGGGSEYQYLESEDGNAFSKIPDEWVVVREGAVAWSLLDDSRPTQFGFVSGDDTTPWRAVFTATPSGQFELDRPSGLIEVQHVDARVRDRFDVESFLKTVPDFGEPVSITPSELEVVDRRAVRVGDLTGYRVELSADIVGRHYDQLVLSDREHRALYIVSLSCSEKCLDRYADDVEEIIQTFRVEL